MNVSIIYSFFFTICLQLCNKHYANRHLSLHHCIAYPTSFGSVYRIQYYLSL